MTNLQLFPSLFGKGNYMQKVFFHTALKVLDNELKDKHITTMFSEFSGNGAFSTSTEEDLAIITDIVFWEKAGVVVALVDCDLAHKRHQFFVNQGYKYDYEYKPHITLEYTKKDKTNKYKHLIGKRLWIGMEYFKPIYK